MSRFFISPECIKGNIALVVGQEAHHILDVMRLKKGDRIQAFDGQGSLYEGKILDAARPVRKKFSNEAGKSVKVKIERVLKDTQATGLEITLVQALPKKNKMDYIVEKSTELGVDVIIPTQTARTVVKLDKAGQLTRWRRWQRIAQEAAKQCGRTTIPRLKHLVPWADALTSLGDFDLKLLACLSEKTARLKDVLRAPLEKSFVTARAQDKARRVALFIGPEGDFTPDEVRQARDTGCITVSLGKTVLKSDTAALCALAMINYELR